MLKGLSRTIASTLFAASGAFAADVPVYTVKLSVDCDAKQYESMSVTHRIIGGLRFLLGHEAENIKMRSLRVGDELVLSKGNEVTYWRPSFGLRTVLQQDESREYGLEIKSDIEIRNHMEFCDAIGSGLVYSLHVGNLHAVNLELARGIYFDATTHPWFNFVSPSDSKEEERAIDFIGRRYFDSLREFFSNKFGNFLKWQSELVLEYNYSRSSPKGRRTDMDLYYDNAAGINRYLAFYEEQELYYFEVTDDASDFRLSEAPFVIEFPSEGNMMHWKGNAGSVCLKESDEMHDISLWFC